MSVCNLPLSSLGIQWFVSNIKFHTEVSTAHVVISVCIMGVYVGGNGNTCHLGINDILLFIATIC